MLVDISFVFLLQTIGVFASAVLAFRLLHRLYYVLNGHLHYYSYDPKKEMEKFLQDNSIKVSDHLIKSTIDNVNLRYRKIGTGKKYYLLANGVGTDFYMWLPVLQQMLNRSKQAHDSDEVKKKRSKLSCKNGAAYSNGLFDEITLVVLSYRGLFETQDTDAVVNIEINYCIEDIIQVMKHVNIPKYDGVIGWSTGAQISLALIARYPNIFDSIFLLNPSLGLTLHTSLQPVVPFPSAIGKAQSKFAKKAIEYLETLINTEVWDVLKIVALSIGFRWSLELLAFMGGFPPEQPVYFHAYMRDVFANRCQTRGLLDLILSLDEPLAEDYINYKKKTFIVSGFPDFVTGVYHSQRLAKSMPHAKHTMFRMGSHFLLLEWPDLLAEEILEFMDLTSSG